MLGLSLWWSPLLMQYLTHSTSSSRFPLNFEPLHFSYRFSWSTVYSSASLSNLEPGMPSSSVRTVQDWSELLAIHVFFPITLTEFDFVFLSHDGGQNVVTSLVQSAIVLTLCAQQQREIFQFKVSKTTNTHNSKSFILQICFNVALAILHFVVYFANNIECEQEAIITK